MAKVMSGETITQRQAEALALHESGLSPTAIAGRLGCSRRGAIELMTRGLHKRERAAREAEVALIYATLKRRLLGAPIGRIAGELLRAAECPQRRNFRGKGVAV